MTTKKKAPAKLKLVTENQQVQMAANEADAALQVVQQFANATRFKWWQLGGAVLAIKEHNYWNSYDAADKEPFHSFEDFINRTLQKGRSTAYRAMSLRKELSTLTEDDANRIPLVKAMWLLKLKKRAGESKWCNPKWIESATDASVTEDAFAELVNAALPGAAKEEDAVTIKLRVDKSLAKQFEKLMKIAKQFGECERDDEALEWVIAYVFNGRCENVTYEASNLDVFEGKKPKKTKAAKQSKSTSFNPSELEQMPAASEQAQ